MTVKGRTEAKPFQLKRGLADQAGIRKVLLHSEDVCDFFPGAL